jgi:hypothetical protein
LERSRVAYLVGMSRLITFTYFVHEHQRHRSVAEQNSFDLAWDLVRSLFVLTVFIVCPSLHCTY